MQYVISSDSSTFLVNLLGHMSLLVFSTPMFKGWLYLLCLCPCSTTI